MIARAIAVLGLLSLAACGGTGAGAPAGGSANPDLPDPAGTVWLCRPGISDNPCLDDRTATVVMPDGKTSLQRPVPAGHPPIDCFYVYPTVSSQKTLNANLARDPEEIDTAMAQASRLSQVCDVYAPMYRQLTLHGLTSATRAARSIAYASLLSGWRDYLAHYNHGRGFVLIGHSQGASLLINLIREQVDGNAKLRRQLVSAVILGGNVEVAAGRRTGGDFRNIPSCASPAETGCVVAYSSFDQPPPPGSLFGRPRQGVSLLGPPLPPGDLQVLCTNPASLGGGSGILEPYFPTSRIAGPGGAAGSLPGLRTPWVTLPDQYRAQCESAGGAVWLQVSDDVTPGDRRPAVRQTLGPAWGLHLVDVNIALGNLVAIVGSQSSAYSRR
jgi:hypothetical protein